MEIPPLIREKLERCEREANTILEEANALITEFDATSIQLKISSSSPTPLMNWADQAQSLAFIVRFEHLPELHSFVAARHPRSGLYYLNEIDQIRAALNEYRTIFFNQKDGIFYGAITNLYQKAFSSDAPNPAMRIKALTREETDVSVAYVEHLKSRKRAIQLAIQRSDFDYIFNGVLQHTSDKFAMQMVKDYTDGSLTYLLLKNLLIAQGLKNFLREHFKVINCLNFPKMGPL